ncbi:protein kinase [Streptosporangium sp. NPDC000563]|uniref:serine/threonine-protein kinase n=1 Tax=Streptosporangium sp. NPDC000563 TaxID=3154366 RepID=UPI003327B2F9
MTDDQPMQSGEPSRISAYRIVRRIGEGGQGVVYLGEADSGTPVAVKLFHIRLGRDSAVRDDFERELKVAKRVARFCTAQVLDFGIWGNHPYIVSEYVPGRSLQEVVTEEGPRSGSALERLAIGTATALVALHDAGIVHRDFKPQNVLIGPDGPRVIDFGIARDLAVTGAVTSRVVGTPAYMAPEQLSAGRPGLALDVFAWASTIAFAATGRPPFGDDAIPVIINRIVNLDPDLDGIETPLRDLLAACLAKDPGRRPTAQQILDRLVRGNGAAPVDSRETSAVDRPDAPTGDGASRSPVRDGTPGSPGGNGGGGSPVRDRESSLPSGGGAVGSPSGAVDLPGGVAGSPGGADASGVMGAATDPDTLKRRGKRRTTVLAVAAAVVVVGVAGAFVALVPVGDSTVPVAGGPRTSSAPTGGTGTIDESETSGGTGTIGEAETSGGTGTPRDVAGPIWASIGVGTVSPEAVPTSSVSDPVASSRPATKPAVPQPSREPSTRTEPSSGDSRPGRSSPEPTRLVELGPGHFTEYCRTIGWEWVEYRKTPTPGAYCVMRKGDRTMYLTQAKRDAGCRWRFDEPKAVHRFKNSSNYCYVSR